MKKLLIAIVMLAVAIGCHKPAPVVTVSSLVPDAEELRSAEVTLHMDTAFTAEERVDALQAAETWRKQTNDLARIVLVFDLDFDDLIGMNKLFTQGANLVVRRDSEDPVVQASDEESECVGCVLGWMNSGGLHGIGHQPIHGAFIADRLVNDRFPSLRVQVMLHEFGHVLGLPHVTSIQAIMFPGVIPGRTSCLKKPDLVAFCSVNECGPTQLYPCE
jgi:hypothetical protein